MWNTHRRSYGAGTRGVRRDGSYDDGGFASIGELRPPPTSHVNVEAGLRKALDLFDSLVQRTDGEIAASLDPRGDTRADFVNHAWRPFVERWNLYRWHGQPSMASIVIFRHLINDYLALHDVAAGAFLITTPDRDRTSRLLDGAFELGAATA
jgi:hypothetical protein